MKKYSVLSLFSGCGGLDLGFIGGFSFLDKQYKQNAFEVVWANDIDKTACLTYENYFKHEIVCGDISEILSGKHIKSNTFPSKADIVLGGFPCQDFSHAGKRKGFDSERGNLYQSMISVVKKTSPKVFVAENVKGLLTLDNGKAIKKIVSDFESIGYSVNYKLLHAADYGVPQKRERVLIVGTRKDTLPEFSFRRPPLSSTDWISVGEAIGDIANVPEGNIENHYWSKAKVNNGQGNSTVKRDEPAPTMRAEHHGNISSLEWWP